jgi:hypothetical protein
VFNATFPEYPEKTADLPQVTEKRYHIMLNWEHIAITSIYVLVNTVTNERILVIIQD